MGQFRDGNYFLLRASCIIRKVPQQLTLMILKSTKYFPCHCSMTDIMLCTMSCLQQIRHSGSQLSTLGILVWRAGHWGKSPAMDYSGIRRRHFFAWRLEYVPDRATVENTDSAGCKEYLHPMLDSANRLTLWFSLSSTVRITSLNDTVLTSLNSS